MTRFVFAILLLFSAFLSFGQDECQKTTEGADFWFGFMENRDGSEERFVEITVTAREATSFDVFIGPDQTLIGSYSVNANDSRQVKIPWQTAETLGSEEISDQGIHLVAQKPVNVYALNWDIYSADIAVIYPVSSLGTEYFAMCYYPDIDRSNPFNGSGKNSEFLVVATEDNTTVEITPSKVTHLLQPADTAFSVVLDKGEVYQVQSENLLDTDEQGQGDLTGSHILSDKPVAFYSGSLATRVPNGQCCWDHLYEQIPPIQAWGLEYFTVPLKSREQDRYRIMAAEDNTVVQVTGRNPINLDRGEFEELVFSKNDPKRIHGNKPILVAQFSQSNYTDSLETGGDGDPFMIILSSTAQTKKDVTFVTYKSPELEEDSTYIGIKKYFVNIISKTKDTSGIQLNGTFIGDQFMLFPEQNEYAFAQVPIEQGVHRLVDRSDGDGFLAYAYGFGGFESFGYGVGFNLNLVLDLGESNFFEEDTLLLCNGDTLTLNAGRYFDSYKWSTGADSQTIEVTESNLYYVETTTNEGCILRDTVFVYKSSPVTNLDVEDLEECEPFSIELQGNDGYENYIWQNETGDTLSTQQKIIADENGTYQITVIDEFNCTASDRMQLTIHPVPEIEISSDELICGGNSTSLVMSVTDAPDSLWKYDGSFTWSAEIPEDVSFSDENHTSTAIQVNDWGTYEIYYQLNTIDACQTTDTFQIGFYPKPSSDFEFADPGKCQEYITQIIYTGDATQDANLMWDFGSSKIIDLIAWDSLNISLGSFNTNPVVQLVVEENGCYSDTTLKPIGANPNFSVETINTRGCDALEVNFSSKLDVPDEVSYEWNFGDGTEVSQEQNPSHFYSSPGFYDVDLTVTNSISGCQAGFQVDSLVKIFPTPTAEIAAEPDFCYPDTAEIFYPFSIDSTIAFWEFSGMHQIGDGNDSITVVLDEPTATVQLSVDEFGCMSDTVQMQLKRKPDFDFEIVSTEGCVPYYAEIKAVPFDDQLNFGWITDSIPFPGEVITFTYQDSGKYDVGLIAGSTETGCTDTLIKTDWIEVHPKPVADFGVDYAVALIDNATITFTNLSENAEYFYWDFGDGAISAEYSPAHTYEAIGEFTTTLMVESEEGCMDTTDYVITIIPNAIFAPNAFRPDSPIEENRTFMPLGQDAYQFNFNLKIYNRWGELIFESESVNRPWDGTTKGGNPAPMGNYVWIADYTDVQGVEHHQKGQVLLIR